VGLVGEVIGARSWRQRWSQQASTAPVTRWRCSRRKINLRSHLACAAADSKMKSFENKNLDGRAFKRATSNPHCCI